MKTALQGQLDDAVLANLLQYLALNQASGCLRLRNERAEVGEVFFELGRVVHVVCDDLIDIHGLSVLLTWTSGNFRFRPNVASPAHSIKLSLDSLLLEASYQVDVQKLSLNDSFSQHTVLEPALSDHQQKTVALSLRSLHVLRQCDGRRSLGAIAEDIGEDLDIVLRLAHELAKQSLVSIAQSPTVPPTFIRELRHLIADKMGPIAEIVIEDVLYDLGFDIDNMPQNAVPEFLDELNAQLAHNSWHEELKRAIRKLCDKHKLYHL